MKPHAPALHPKAADSPMSFTTNISVPYIPPRQKASTACRECKRRKCKDGDMRRKLGNRRKIDKLEKEKVPPAQLELSIDSRLAEQDQKQTPIWPGRYDHARSSSDSKGPHCISLHRARSTKQLVDAPICYIPAKPWPSVTGSDEFVSHLVSIWLTWSQPFYNLVNRDLFLRDAQAEVPTSEFCSPFLMNCILTEACTMVDKVDGQCDLATSQGCGLFTICKGYSGPYPLLTTLTPQGRVASDAANWAIYNLSAMTSIAWMNAVQSHSACVFSNLCELSTISMYASALIFGSGQIPPLDSLTRTLKTVREKLDQWRDNLPDMVYQASVMILWGLLKEQGDAAQSSTKNIRLAARQVCLNAAEAFVQLLRNYRTKWGIDYMSLTTIICLNTALFTLLDELGDLGCKNAFMELCLVARACSRKWPLMKGHMRMLQLSAQRKCVSLLPETHALFVDFEATIWDRHDHERFRGIYPNLSAVDESNGTNIRWPIIAVSQSPFIGAENCLRQGTRTYRS
ncbi:hypothetical protein BDQ94DRAFT_164493 [Aspergillus welwitschiae]|uniref:Uncharacterized protein n=1 Tax=Aspergillus welwitschiae TaxID=1341132 RepID=A0A3F3PHJ3_9EURO|nr:hypothetical protein BDQ94DRAFT_164493 [Aspergillus welwitschiae]RDH26434.1 hypothetical protein BDQ94DRAFT_164493 [Aspergillus welwitschiae]